jgi:hypothetical protein
MRSPERKGLVVVEGEDRIEADTDDADDPEGEFQGRGILTIFDGGQGPSGDTPEACHLIVNCPACAEAVGYRRGERVVASRAA